MTDYFISGDENEYMYSWIEQHDKVCKYAGLSPIKRFSYDDVKNSDLCVVRVTCKCGEVKVVTICSKE
jgi:hypothetical protein